jgi:hypothetical protein
MIMDHVDAHTLHHRANRLTPDLKALAAQEIAEHPAACKGIIQMQRIDPAHDHKGACRHRTGLIIDAAAAQLEELYLPRQRQSVAAINHLFALNRPALLSAPDKKSFSSASSPIFACSVFKSTEAAPEPSGGPDPNTPAAPSSS